MSDQVLNAEEVSQVVDAIIALYPRDGTNLRYRSEFELLAAVILSAQTTDQGVNRVTPGHFEEYPTPKAMMEAPVEDIRQLIQSIGLSKNKSKYLKEMAKMLVEEFDSQVPRTRAELMKLPGVGRKTANVVLTNGFNIPAFGVDTHVKRISRKLRFVPKDASVLEIEDIMTKKLPDCQWFPAHQSILDFGRNQCTARTHNHADCLEKLKQAMPDNEVTSSACKKMAHELEE